MMLDSQQLRQMEQQEIQKQLASVPPSMAMLPPQMMGMVPPMQNPNNFPPQMDPQKSSLPSLLTMKITPPNEMSNPNQTDQVDKVLDPTTMKLPAALEQALAFKNERAKEVGRSEFDANDQLNTDISRETIISDDMTVLDDLILETETIFEKTDTRFNKVKKKKKKKKKKHSSEQNGLDDVNKESLINSKEKNMPEIEYVQEIPGVEDLEPMYRQFARVFEAFKLTEPEPRIAEDKGEPIEQYPPLSAAPVSLIPSKAPLLDEFDEDVNTHQQQQQDVGENGAPRLSKRKLKRLTRLSVAELKQLVGRPDVVEMHDVTARQVLQYLKKNLFVLFI